MIKVEELFSTVKTFVKQIWNHKVTQLILLRVRVSLWLGCLSVGTLLGLSKYGIKVAEDFDRSRTERTNR